MTDVIDTTEPTPTIPQPNEHDELMASTAITMTEYGGLQAAFDFMNIALLCGLLPDAFIVYSRKPHSRGHFSDDRYSARDGKFKRPEISLNPDAFIDRTDEQIVSTLVHEMVHLQQARFGKPSKRGYHNREWAEMMKTIGLMPSNSGAIGGKETGQQMSHFIIPNGPFAQAFAKLAATGWRLNLQSTVVAGGTKAPSSKLKFTCQDCAANAWAKPTSELVCKTCLLNTLATLPWLNKTKTNDLVELIDSQTMLPPASNPDVASSSDEGNA
jgi:hypothetical protein